MTTLYDAMAKEAQEVADDYGEKLTNQQAGNIYSRIPQYIRDQTLAEMYIMARIRQDRKRRP